ncbi:hypothetical protein BP422_11680 [Brevibacillus formosus]|uniref:Major facilitator superfamily (MFS) profile domain-containing protein n=1 Tax=Brevibacillus formosus TaxID=54913 RepID=A0A220MGK2_9BACL|nr:MFS transporter [Brevibacillus formosus]ASJ54148.1 hypothetical protein BP422_11680 [Brevibacillus formosus]
MIEINLSTFKPLKMRNYRTLFYAQVCSSFGNWLDMLAINVLISFQWGLDLGANAATIIAMIVPFIVIGPIVSVWIDRWSRKWVMLFCTLARILIVTGFCFAPNLWSLLLLIFMRSTLAAMYEPASQGVLRSVMPKDLLAEASALGQMMLNLTKILAPAIGGLLLTISTPQTIFIVEGVAFIIAFLVLLALPNVEESSNMQQSQNKPQFWSDFKEGVKHVRSRRVLHSAITIVSISMFVIFLYDSFFAPLSLKLGLDQLGYGLISSSLGVGSVIGALVAGMFTAWKKHPLLFMSAGRMLSGCLLLIVGFGGYSFANGNILFWMLTFALIGGIGSALTVPYGYILQSETPSHLMSRVTAVSTAVQGIASLSAPTFGALLGGWLGLGSVFFFSGSCLLLLGLSSFTYIRNKNIRPDREDTFPASS